MMRHFVVVAFGVLVAKACIPYVGELNVSDDMPYSVVTEVSCDEWNHPCEDSIKIKKKVLPAGIYEAKVKLKRDNVAQMTVKREGLRRKHKIKINLPTSDTGDGNFEFDLSSEETGQPWGVAGHMQTEVEESETITDWENCQYTCTGPNGQPHTCNGHRWVEFYNKDTYSDLVFEILDGENHYGQFEGERNTRQKIYLREGICR